MPMAIGLTSGGHNMNTKQIKISTHPAHVIASHLFTENDEIKCAIFMGRHTGLFGEPETIRELADEYGRNETALSYAKVKWIQSGTWDRVRASILAYLRANSDIANLEIESMYPAIINEIKRRILNPKTSDRAFNELTQTYLAIRNTVLDKERDQDRDAQAGYLDVLMGNAGNIVESNVPPPTVLDASSRENSDEKSGGGE